MDNHAEAIEFGNDFILEDGEGADDLGDMNGIDALFDTWNDGKSFEFISKVKVNQIINLFLI